MTINFDCISFRRKYVCVTSRPPKSFAQQKIHMEKYCSSAFLHILVVYVGGSLEFLK